MGARVSLLNTSKYTPEELADYTYIKLPDLSFSLLECKSAMRKFCNKNLLRLYRYTCEIWYKERP